MSTQSKASEFLTRPHGMLVGGAWRSGEGGERIDVVNPATGKVIAHIAAGTAGDADAAVKVARKAFEQPSWSGLTPSARAKLLWKIAETIDANADELAELESLDNGKPRHVARAGDIAGSAEVFRYYAGWCTKINGATPAVSKPGAYHAYTLKEPVGVCGLIIPWNFPLLMAAWKLAPALAAGCTCVLKPAEETSLTALRLGELILEAGIPEGVVNVVTGYGHIVGAALSAHPGVDKIAFTGSTDIGKEIVKAAAGNLKKLSLELGGKSPTIIFADADLGKASEAAAMSIFFNAGQICAAGSRLFVQRAAYDQVIEGVAKIAAGLRVGPGDKSDSQIGPLISAKHFARVSGYVASGVEDGAKVKIGGGGLGGEGYFFKPTVLLDTTAQMKVVREEIFGPVLVAQVFDDFDDVTARANDTIYGLNASIWTRDLSTAHRMARKLQAGAVQINALGGTDPNLPFGGYKQSGWGREFGQEGLELYLQTKSVLVGI